MLKTEVKDTMRATVRNLYPGYFALVMATVIVSVAAHLLGMATLAGLLFWVNLCAYSILILLSVARLLMFVREVSGDLTDHRTGPGFFTTIAGTCVLGGQFVIFFGNPEVGLFFWFPALCLWLILTYAFFTAVIIRPVKPSIERGLHGGWLVTVVSTQSLSVLALLSAQAIPTWERTLLFFALAFYLLGCAMYVALITLIFYRLLFFTLMPEEFAPPYWVNMGAIAITTLPGSLLIQKAPIGPFIHEIIPLLRAFTLLFWVVATWWIPLLAILETWRHLWKRFPIRYSPEYWNIVFPLGMYTAATFELGRATGYGFLGHVSGGMLYLAQMIPQRGSQTTNERGRMSTHEKRLRGVNQ